MRCCTWNPRIKQGLRKFSLELLKTCIQTSCSHLLDVPQDAVPINKGVPRGNALVARQHLKRGGLACSVEAEKAKTLSFPHGQRQPVHSQESLPTGVHLRGRDKRLRTVTCPHTDTRRGKKKPHTSFLPC